MNYLISYNRSGNTWVRYILEYLTHYPTWGHKKFSINDRMGEKSNITLLYNEPILIKRHEIIPDEITENDNLIFLIRDYHECIWNSMNCKWDKFEKEFQKYYKLTDFYCKFKGNKILIRYENLISDPKITIFNILQFLGYGLNLYPELDEFMLNYNDHREKSFSIYQNSINTKDGEKPSFTEEELMYIRIIVSKYDNGEFEDYS